MHNQRFPISTNNKSTIQYIIVMISVILEKLDGLELITTNSDWWKYGLVTLGTSVGALYCIKFWLSSNRKRCTNQTSLAGKTCIVTGANSGIGRAVAAELARRNATVILACRDVQKGSKAALKIRKMVKRRVKLSVYELDLSSFESIRKFVFEINKNSIEVDVLVNNAGIMACPYAKSVDGFEMQFAVNHLGHFLLTNLLLPQMQNKEDARIVTVSSALYKRAKLTFLFNFDDENDYNPSQAYARSKLANILFTKELSKRLPPGITVNSMHPGIVKTNLARHQIVNRSSLKYLYKIFGYFFLRSPEDGAQTIIHMITEPKLKGVTGKYFGNCQIEELLPIADDENVSKKVWEVSERMTGLKS